MELIWVEKMGAVSTLLLVARYICYLQGCHYLRCVALFGKLSLLPLFGNEPQIFCVGIAVLDQSRPCQILPAMCPNRTPQSVGFHREYKVIVRASN